MNVLVDTCVWSRFLRQGTSSDDPVALEVQRLIRADAVQIIGPIRQELLSGAQPQARFDRLKEYLRFYPNLPLDEDDDEQAADYYNTCRRHGIQATSIDLLICAVSVRHKLRIFSTDTDFTRYAKHVPIQLYRTRR